MAKETIIRVPKASAIGALHLVRNAPGHLPPESPLAPVFVYLDSLAFSGHRTQKVNLERAGSLLGGSGLDYDWYSLRSGHVEFVRATMTRKYAPSTINATISALREVARWAWHLKPEWMTAEDLARIKDVGRARASTRRVRPARALSPEEIALLLSTCDRRGGPSGARDAALVAVLFGGGLRRDEASRLNLSDYCQRACTLSISGKGGRERTAYFADGGARRAIHSWLRERGKGPGPFLCPVSRWGLIVIDDARRLSGTMIYRALLRRAGEAGLRHFTPHDLRRTFATWLLNEGCDLDMVRKLMGHVSITSTAIYDMRGEKEKRSASLKIRVPYRGGRKKKRRRRRRRK